MKQQLFLIDNEGKQREKELKQRVEQVEELKCANGKLDDLVGRLKDNEIKLERQLQEVRREVADVQNEHHKQIA